MTEQEIIKEILERQTLLETEMSELADDLRWLNKEWDELEEQRILLLIKNQE